MISPQALSVTLTYWHLQKNHLSGLKRKLLRLRFHNVQQLMAVKRDVFPIVRRNANKSSTAEAYSVFDGAMGAKSGAPRLKVRPTFKSP